MLRSALRSGLIALSVIEVGLSSARLLEPHRSQDGTLPSRYRIAIVPTAFPSAQPREGFRPYVLPFVRRRALDVTTRIARIDRAEPHTKWASHGAA